jgi:hypothetical protein
MLRTVRRLRGFLIPAALLALVLWWLMPETVPWWAPLAIFGLWVAAVLYAVGHVLFTRRSQYRCPHCGWVPYAIEAWKCKGCGRAWDSFAAVGVCTSCGHQHEETACLRCRRVTPKSEWVKG